MKGWPLRWQLALLTSTLVVLVLFCVGAAACWQLYRQGIYDIDRELRHISGEFFQNAADASINWSDRSAVRQLMPVTHYAFLSEVLDAKGTSLFRFRGVGAEGLPKLQADHDAIQTLSLNGHLARVANYRQGRLELRLLMELHIVERTRDDLIQCFLVATPLVLLVVGFGGVFVARRALAPIQQIAASAERITAQRLDQRLPLPQTGDEIERLTVVLNHTFDRLEASFLQATRFTADASHELKTPLTVIRGELEAAISSRQFEPAQERLLVNLLEETERLTQIFEGLLLLSRADAGRLKYDLEPVDLLSMLRELLEDAEALASPSGITVEAELPEAASVVGESRTLRQLLLNLIDNAIKYNEDGGQVKITLEEAGDCWSIRVANTGPGVPEGDRKHVFDRFFRGDASRSRKTGHGLGLSICREIVRAHDGEITLNAGRVGWTEFQVKLLKAELPERVTAGMVG